MEPSSKWPLRIPCAMAFGCVLLMRSATLAASAPVQPSPGAPPETIKVTDQAGRTLTLPKTIRKIFSISPMGTILVYTLAPEKLLGWNSEFAPEVKEFLLPEYRTLPNLSGWYATYQANYEQIVNAHPDLLITMWAEPEGPPNLVAMEKDLRVSEKLGIPMIVLDGRVEMLADAYRLLGKLIGKEKRAEELARYAQETVAEVKAKAARISKDRRVSAFYAEGPDGLLTDPEGSSHAELLRFVNAKNVADVPVATGQGGAGMNAVSMEQLLAWNPDVIIVGVTWGPGYKPAMSYELIRSGKRSWQAVRAVKADRVYAVPHLPFNWFDRPPSANRLIGIKWIGNLLYPDIFDYDIRAETKHFYQLFYHMELNDAQLDQILSRSTRRPRKGG